MTNKSTIPVLDKFKKFIENHLKDVYLNNNDDVEFCFCQNLSCEDCILITDCAKDPISHIPPFLKREDLNNFKSENPEYFV